MSEIKGNGLVSGVSYNPSSNTVIVVLDLERKINGAYKYALPGGMVEPGETPEEAMRREWEEEVGAEIRSLKRSISRSRKGGEYNHDFFRIELAKSRDNLRLSGMPGETGPPERVFLMDLILGDVKMHFSHRKGLCLTMKKEVLEMAKEDKEIAFALTELGITR